MMMIMVTVQLCFLHEDQTFRHSLIMRK